MRCPICGRTLMDLERVVATHTPASVPEHASKVYSMTRRFTVVECEEGHRFERGGPSNDTLVGRDRPALLWLDRRA